MMTKKVQVPRWQRVKLATTIIATLGVVNAIGCLLLFKTSLGDGFQPVFKIGVPLFSWAVGSIFFLAHRTPDHKDVEFRIW
jgi:hypothetical protein